MVVVVVGVGFGVVVVVVVGASGLGVVTGMGGHSLLFMHLLLSSSQTSSI